MSLGQRERGKSADNEEVRISDGRGRFEFQRDYRKIRIRDPSPNRNQEINSKSRVFPQSDGRPSFRARNNKVNHSI